MTSFDVQDSLIVFFNGAFPHLGTSLGTQKESQQFGKRSNLEISSFREVFPEPFFYGVMHFRCEHAQRDKHTFTWFQTKPTTQAGTAQDPAAGAALVGWEDGVVAAKPPDPTVCLPESRQSSHIGQIADRIQPMHLCWP